MVRAADSAALAGSASRVGAEDAQRRVALELVEQPAAGIDGEGQTLAKRPFTWPTSSSGGVVGQRGRVDDVTNNAVTSRTSPNSEAPYSSACLATSAPTCRPNRSRMRSCSRSPATNSTP
jgi:hypothetical protein